MTQVLEKKVISFSPPDIGEEEIKEVLQYLKEENVKIPEKYKIDFNKKYKYIAKIDDHDDSKLYLIYISDEKRIYIVENIY